MLDDFYDVLSELSKRTGGPYLLSDCSGMLNWPRQGIYFFFECGETRRGSEELRVVRVGTHAVSRGSKTTLWNRLSQHRGMGNGGGNHRGSIFRLHVGTALIRRDYANDEAIQTWGVRGSADKPTRMNEQRIEEAVSAYIRQMPFLVVKVEDESGRDSLRARIEKGSIRLLSAANNSRDAIDTASPRWLGRYAKHPRVRESHMWNVRDTVGARDPGFLDCLTQCADRTEPLRQ